LRVETRLRRQIDAQIVEVNGEPPETRTPDPLIKSLVNGTPEQNINKKIQLFQRPLALYSTMAGVCSAQVQAQNEHSRGLTEPAFAFVDINIGKGRLQGGAPIPSCNRIGRESIGR